MVLGQAEKLIYHQRVKVTSNWYVSRGKDIVLNVIVSDFIYLYSIVCYLYSWCFVIVVKKVMGYNFNQFFTNFYVLDFNLTM